MEYFKNQYCDTNTRSIQDLLQGLGSLQIPKLDADQRNYLDRPVKNEEVELAVFQLGPQKSLSPDGIPAFFYQDLWKIVRQDIFNFVHAFFHSGNLLKSLNQTFIALIPKIRDPKEVAHFRPISLCNVTYKIISKNLVSRLKPFMDSLITPYQNAFIQGRNITDNILLAHEIFDMLGKKKHHKFGFGALKIDMSKAYARVNWNFLKAVLISMNFSDKWIEWIMECVTSVQYSLLINGSPTKPFTPSSGPRQGNPISPYLFLFCANILSVALSKEESQNKIKGFTVGRNGVSFTHLLFADDSLFFFNIDKTTPLNLKNTILWYCNLSGQCINFSKFDLNSSPNTPQEVKDNLAQSLQVNLVLCPSKYLGINFKLRGKRVADFQDIIDKVQGKLQGW